MTERATGELSIGGGYSTDAGPLADVGLRERNLLGTGIDARHQRHAGAAPQPGRLLGHRPVLPRPQPRGRLRHLLHPAQPAGHRLLPRAAPGLRACAGLRVQRAAAADLGLHPDAARRSSTSRPMPRRFIREQAGTHAAVADRPDPDLRPAATSASIRAAATSCALGTDFAGLGGDVAYVRARLRRHLLHPAGARTSATPTTCSRSPASVGYLEPLFGKQERIIDRFFLGGENLRGFRIAGAGPRDTSDAATASAAALLWTQTHRVALPAAAAGGTRAARPRLRRRRLAVSSSVQPAPAVADDASPRVGAGVGVSWRSPFGLINIDLAQAVVKQSYDRDADLPLRLRHAVLSITGDRPDARAHSRSPPSDLWLSLHMPPSLAVALLHGRPSARRCLGPAGPAAGPGMVRATGAAAGQRPRSRQQPAQPASRRGPARPAAARRGPRRRRRCRPASRRRPRSSASSTCRRSSASPPPSTRCGTRSSGAAQQAERRSAARAEQLARAAAAAGQPARQPAGRPAAPARARPAGPHHRQPAHLPRALARHRAGGAAGAGRDRAGARRGDPPGGGQPQA